MNLRQFESFLAIAELGSFAAAAERLHITQSAISARIQELEQLLGVELFDRSQRRVQLTVKGRELVADAELITELIADVRSRVGSKNSLTGVVRVGVVELVAVTWLPKFAELVRNDYPGIQLEFEVGLNPFLMDSIRSGNIDVAIVAGEFADPTLDITDLGTVRFCWMASPLLGVPDDVLEPRDLRRWPVIYQGSESFTNEAINGWLGVTKTRKHRGTSCNSLGAISALTLGGLGIGFLPVSTVADLTASGQLKILHTNPKGFDMPFSVIHVRQKTASLLSDISKVSVRASTFSRSGDPGPK